MLFGVFLLFIGFACLYQKWSAWPWSTIGVALAFAGVLVMLLRDTIKDYGNTHNSAEDAKQGGKPLARLLNSYIYAVGVPLVVLGALFQMIGNPDDKLVLRAKEFPKDTVYFPVNSDTGYIDVKKFEETLRLIDAHQKATDASLGTLTYPELLVVNCGASTECACPQEYSRVKDTGKWNLNAGTKKGDAITLCSKERKYEHLQK